MSYRTSTLLTALGILALLVFSAPSLAQTEEGARNEKGDAEEKPPAPRRPSMAPT